MRCPKCGCRKYRKNNSEIEDARRIYEEYLAKQEVLKKYRAYASKVLKDLSTKGGLTPVMPLVFDGTDGGPLICDLCKKEIPLESQPWYGMFASDAWAANPEAGPDWYSYILGGFTVTVEINGTLRIYHGYDNAFGSCCQIAIAREDKAIKEHKMDYKARDYARKVLRPFFMDEFPELTPEEIDDLVRKVTSTLFDYDPGLGINQPS
jgi:hypothetical protein